MLSEDTQYFVTLIFIIKPTNAHIISKGKAIPLQAWTDPEGSRRLRLPDFKTIEVARLSALRTGLLYPPGNIHGTHFC
jgi:hypothetical protein